MEQSISEHLTLFHSNGLFSSTVIEVDFDLAMTTLAYHLIRLLTFDLPSVGSRYDRLLCTGGEIHLAPDLCTVALKKKYVLPALLETFQAVGTQHIPLLDNR